MASLFFSSEIFINLKYITLYIEQLLLIVSDAKDLSTDYAFSFQNWAHKNKNINICPIIYQYLSIFTQLSMVLLNFCNVPKVVHGNIMQGTMKMLKQYI